MTGESESMLSEASATGKPLFIYPLPERRPERGRGLAEWVLRRSRKPRLNKRGTIRPQRGLQYLCARLIDRGWVRPRRELTMLHQALVEAGVAQMFGRELAPGERPELREAEHVAARVRAMWSRVVADANLVIVRHGRSEWNTDRRMTGWSDVDLNARGREQARAVGRILRESRVRIRSRVYILAAARRGDAGDRAGGDGPAGVARAAKLALNERHYGVMQGMSRQQAARSSVSAVRHLAERLCSASAGGRRRRLRVFRATIRATRNCRRSRCPGREHAGHAARVLPCWEEDIVPALGAGKRVLVVAHKTSVRAMRKQLEGISDEAYLLAHGGDRKADRLCAG